MALEAVNEIEKCKDSTLSTLGLNIKMVIAKLKEEVKEDKVLGNTSCRVYDVQSKKPNATQNCNQEQDEIITTSPTTSPAGLENCHLPEPMVKSVTFSRTETNGYQLSPISSPLVEDQDKFMKSCVSPTALHLRRNENHKNLDDMQSPKKKVKLEQTSDKLHIKQSCLKLLTG